MFFKRFSGKLRESRKLICFLSTEGNTLEKYWMDWMGTWLQKLFPATILESEICGVQALVVLGVYVTY